MLHGGLFALHEHHKIRYAEHKQADTARELGKVEDSLSKRIMAGLFEQAVSAVQAARATNALRVIRFFINPTMSLTPSHNHKSR
ncbi:hypothetical protein [Lentibacter algarum]|uniref:hypothetical protein n=1 Tax=Lentibacter TaxID=1434014 RepID=UPI003BB19B71